DNHYIFVQLTSVDFLSQVEIFESARTVVSVLGSDLAGLIYASPGIRVISAAPATFGYRFFYALVIDREGRYIDLRGPVEESVRPDPYKSRFVLDPQDLKQALEIGEDERIQPKQNRTEPKAMERHELINSLISAFGFTKYLEIGVAEGTTFFS